MRFLLLPVMAALLVGCAQNGAEPEVAVEDARVQLPAVPGRPGTAYFTLTSTNEPTKLVAVESPRIERIELHETVTEGGLSKMRPLQDTTFQQGSLAFTPGGKHAMLFGIDPALKAGDKVTLTFRLEPMPEPVTVEAEVKAFGAEGMSHMGH